MSEKHTDLTDRINSLIYELKEEELLDVNNISDTYHTFGELYEHRYVLFATTLNVIQGLFEIVELTEFDYDGFDPSMGIFRIWKSKAHADGSDMYPGYFLAGIELRDKRQITYHLPLTYWDSINVPEYMIPPCEYDGHTSSDVLERLKEIRTIGDTNGLL